MLYHHSGHLGDIIYGMPAMRAMASVEGAIDLEISPVNTSGAGPMTPEKVDSLRPLLLSGCDFIRSVTFVEKMTANARNFDVFRTFRVPPEGTNLAVAQLWLLKGYSADCLSVPWIKVDAKPVVRVIINRCPRWHEPGAEEIWRRVADNAGGDAAFIGPEEEWLQFQQQVGRCVRCLPTANLLEAARVIAGAEFFVGNQSACLAIAQATRHPRIAFERLTKADSCSIPQIPTTKFDEREKLEGFLDEISRRQ